MTAHGSSDSCAAAALSFDWPALPQCPRIEPGVVHLVATRLPEGLVCGEDRWALLGEAESRRARRLRFDEHRNRWVAGRSLLKQLLARYARCEAADIRLRVGPIGKPFLDHPSDPDLQFNYTDSHGCLIYAFARGIEVGVDLEKLPRPTRYEGLARRKLSVVEQAALAGIDADEQEGVFLAAWTRKEAYGKALGVGVRYPMAEVTLCESFAEPRYVVIRGDGADHGLAQVQPPFAGIACVAAAAPAFRIEAYRIVIGDAINA